MKQETPNLHSNKEGHFCPCSGHFLAWSIFDKKEDKVPFPKSYRKSKLKGGFESLKYGFESLSSRIRILIPMGFAVGKTWSIDSNPLRDGFESYA